MEYYPVHPDAIEAARKKLEEAEVALNALLDQQHGFECQNNPLLDLIRKGAVLEHRIAGGFFLNDDPILFDDPLYEHAYQLEDLDPPQIEWRPSNYVEGDYYTTPSEYTGDFRDQAFLVE